jgi:NAD(P)-dependent dehydrogenase (short-subunit alcohol dehydrogenase family)
MLPIGYEHRLSSFHCLSAPLFSELADGAQGLICPAYNASKAGVVQLARNLASEWGMYGIRVNTISPGYIVTAMVEALFVGYPERKEEWPKQNMLGRLSKPEEYRGAAVFLISDASSFMTGSDLRIDGGYCAW